MIGYKNNILKYLINSSSLDKKVYADVMFVQFLLIESDKEFKNVLEFKDYIANDDINVDKLTSFFNFPNLSDSVNSVLMSHLPLIKTGSSVAIDSNDVKQRVYDFLDRLEKNDILYPGIILNNKDWFININLNKSHIVM